MIECAESPIFIPNTECDSCTEYTQELSAVQSQIAALENSKQPKMTAKSPIAINNNQIQLSQTYIDNVQNGIDSAQATAASKQDPIICLDPIQKQGDTLSLGPLFIVKQFTCTYSIQPYGYADLTPQQFGIPNGTPVGYKALTLRQLSSGDNFVSITSWTGSAISQGSKFATFANHSQTFLNPTALTQIVFVKESLIDPSSVQ